MSNESTAPRHHGLGKLLLAIHSLVWGGADPQNPKFIAGDIRLRLIDCMIDFELACLSLKGTIPAELEQEIAAICNEFEQWSPKPFDQPRTSKMFNRGLGAKGRGIARALSEFIRTFTAMTRLQSDMSSNRFTP